MKTLACAAILLIGVSSINGQPAPDAVLVNSYDMQLARIPAGKFLMGSPTTEAERDPEEFQHEVVVTKPFYLGVHLVTQAAYQRLMGKNPSHFVAKDGDAPVEQVRYKEAEEFCAKLSNIPAEAKAGRTYRLPTEAEWEYACRAGTTTAFNTGDAISSTQANFNGNHPYGGAAKGPYLQKTTKTGAYPPNAWGLRDMHGNVGQWCSDWYDPDYYKNSPREDPKGPAKGVMGTGFASDFFRVVRGGCWLDEARGCRAAFRYRFQSSEPYRLVGFRVVCVVKEGKS